MNPATPSDLDLQLESLRQDVYSLTEAGDSNQTRDLDALRAPLEPGLADALDHLFRQTPAGREEAKRMELDILRRLSRCDQTEQIFRPYGILELVTPVRIKGNTCFALCSGPLLVEEWTPVARETLAKLSGVSVAALPEALASASLYSPAQIAVVSRLQQQTADWIRTAFETPQADGADAPPFQAGALQLLQPGFLDHLDMLYSGIQHATAGERDLPAAEAARVRKIAERGRTLTEQARRLRDQAEPPSSPQSVHAVLRTWCSTLENQQPHLRIRTRFEAGEDTLTTTPEPLHHLVYTLLSGIADGLPEGRALLGVSTRNTEIDGHPMIHVEIRDGGGLATFAGVGGETDSLLEAEQHQVTEDTSEWTALASRCNARIRILRDSDAVTRAEVFLPLTRERADETDSTGTHALWIVEDDDREVDHLLHMVRDLPLSCTRFRSAAELKEKFSTARTAPDMVLLKYYLPDERGAEVRSWLYEQDPDLPVILISSLNATHPGIATAHRLPSTLYLQKPFTASDLLNMIHLNLDDTLSG